MTPPAAQVHAHVFSDQNLSEEWLECGVKAFPKCQLFVAEQSNKIIGLIFWTEKSGFREKAFFELEQIAVHPNFQSRGIGSQLITKSLPELANKIAERGASLTN